MDNSELIQNLKGLFTRSTTSKETTTTFQGWSISIIKPNQVSYIVCLSKGGTTHRFCIKRALPHTLHHACYIMANIIAA